MITFILTYVPEPWPPPGITTFTAASLTFDSTLDSEANSTWLDTVEEGASLTCASEIPINKNIAIKSEVAKKYGDLITFKKLFMLTTSQ